jgi:recombination protein RecA
MYDIRRQRSRQRSAGSARGSHQHEHLVAVIAALRERYGQHIIRFGSLPAATREDWQTLSSGSLGLDLLSGGLPRGALVEYAGVDGSGKETLALSALAHCQRSDGVALLLDAEGTADPDALTAAGINLDTLTLACPITAQEAWSALAALARCGALDLLVASLPALAGLPGRFMGGLPPRALARLRLALRGRRTTVLVTNVPCPSRAGRQNAGGQAMAQAAALRVALEPGRPIIAPHGDIAGLRTTVRVVKHHGFAHSTALSLEIAAQGPRRAAELLSLGRRAGCVEEHPVGLVAGGHVLGRSPAHAIRCLEADPVLAARLEEAIRVAWTTQPLKATGSAR